MERLWTGARWAEGPVWFGDLRSLIFSDIPNDRLPRWSEETGEVSVFRSPSRNANGNTRDRQGRLITCEHRSRRVTRTEIDGTVTVLIDAFEGRRLNAPNDVAFSPDYRRLYVADTGASHKRGHPRRIHVFEVIDGRRLGELSVFHDFGDASAGGSRGGRARGGDRPCACAAWPGVDRAGCSRSRG